MSVVVRHQPIALTREKYDQVSRSMEGEGAWPPEGLDMHVLFGTEGELRVSEIWDSEEQFRSFLEQLKSALGDAGVEFDEPEVYEVHELQKREGAAT
jgi:hypothetical protein